LRDPNSSEAEKLKALKTTRISTLRRYQEILAMLDSQIPLNSTGSSNSKRTISERRASPSLTPSQSIIAQEAELYLPKKLRSALAHLNDRQRSIIIALCDLDGFGVRTQKDLSADFGISVAAISKHFVNATKILRRVLKSDLPNLMRTA